MPCCQSWNANCVFPDICMAYNILATSHTLYQYVSGCDMWQSGSEGDSIPVYYIYDCGWEISVSLSMSYVSSVGQWMWHVTDMVWARLYFYVLHIYTEIESPSELDCHMSHPPTYWWDIGHAESDRGVIATVTYVVHRYRVWLRPCLSHVTSTDQLMRHRTYWDWQRCHSHSHT